MSSKYDTYWHEQLPELRKAMARAASGHEDEITISEIRNLGERGSWYGIAFIRDTSVLSASIAHMRSLANTIVSAALCSAWPEMTFRFATRSDGIVLTVMAQPDRTSPPGSAVPGSGRRSIQLGEELATRQGGVETPVDATLTCGEIHALLHYLPRCKAPSEVPFSTGCTSSMRTERVPRTHQKAESFGSATIPEYSIVWRLGSPITIG